MLNADFHKNQTRGEVKSHHYIISFDPKDVTECGLTGEKAQALGREFAERFFAGHQALICTHTDGHNSSGNIHVHIVINSLRKFDVERQDFMERSNDSRAGFKHHQTRELLTAMQKGLMELTEREGLHQIDLLSPAPVKITEREYRKTQREQRKPGGKTFQTKLQEIPAMLSMRRRLTQKAWKNSRMLCLRITGSRFGSAEDASAICILNGKSISVRGSSARISIKHTCSRSLRKTAKQKRESRRHTCSPSTILPSIISPCRKPRSFFAPICIWLWICRAI